MAEETVPKARTPLLSLERRGGHMCAVLHEEGKMDTIMPINAEQLKWFNALRRLLRQHGLME